MRHNILLISSLFLLAACAIHQENGNQWGYNAPPLVAGNHWQIAQYRAKNGDLVCIVSAGEMNVVQRAQGKTVALQVETSTPLNPGDRYRVIYGNDVHETLNGESAFHPADSKAIIADLMKGGIVYTEIQQREIQTGGGEFERLGNKIDLSGFGEQFKTCTKFVKSGSAHQ